MQANKGYPICLTAFTLGHLKHLHNTQNSQNIHKLTTHAKTKMAQPQANEELNTIPECS
jgi:hypothetical protein